jgi:hypothetical protein
VNLEWISIYLGRRPSPSLLFSTEVLANVDDTVFSNLFIGVVAEKRDLSQRPDSLQHWQQVNSEEK